LGGKKYRTEDWNQLLGFHVEVRLDGEVMRTGMVAETSADANVLWLAPDGAWTRTLIHKTEGYKIWIDEEHLAKLQTRLKTKPVLG
jgi:hypothetical protein